MHYIRLLLLMLVSTVLSFANAAILNVDTAADELIDDSACSLREAIIAANQDADFHGCVATNLPYGADEIDIDPTLLGTPHFIEIFGTGEDNAMSGDFDVTDDLTINGDPLGSSIDGNFFDRVLDVPVDGVVLTLNRLVISSGEPPISTSATNGGCIRMAADGHLVLNDTGVILCEIHTGNQAGAYGGGIYSLSDVTLNRSNVINSIVTAESDRSVFGAGIVVTGGAILELVEARISGNHGESVDGLAAGGGISAGNGASIVLVRSEVGENTVLSTSGDAFGGGIYLGGGDLDMINTTISGNSATAGGFSLDQAQAGGVFASLGSNGVFTANNSTVFNNSAEVFMSGNASFGGINVFGSFPGAIQLANTVIAGNTSDGNPSDCGNGVDYTSLGHNLVQTNCGITAATGDQFGVSSELDILANNSGPHGFLGNPRSHAPLAGSPVLDAGNPGPAGGFPDCDPVDQRGISRPRDGDGDNATRCDIGAVELNPDIQITVVLAGPGVGTVVSSPPGIDCPGTCSADFPAGETTTLTQSAEAGSEFLNWSGACNGSSSCDLAPIVDSSVTAVFGDGDAFFIDGFE